MSRPFRKLTAGALALAISVSPASAGIADFPVPSLGPSPTKHVWSITGVRQSGYLRTVVACTNASDRQIVIGVEVFGPGGGAPLNDVTTTGVASNAGQTVLFSTGALLAFPIDVNLGLGPITMGSARVIASPSKALMCRAFLAGPNATPGYIGRLPVVPKLKQRGD